MQALIDPIKISPEEGWSKKSVGLKDKAVKLRSTCFGKHVVRNGLKRSRLLGGSLTQLQARNLSQLFWKQEDRARDQFFCAK
jgi:hypothetical protein